LKTFTLTISQREVLRSLPSRVPVARIDRLWLFEPRIGKSRESGLVVLSTMPEAPPFSEQRRLLTLRYRAEPVRGRLERSEKLTEEGSAPPAGIERVIAGVLARSGEEAGEPMAETVGGSDLRWTQLLERLGIAG